MKIYSLAFLISISILLLSLQYTANLVVYGLYVSNLPANPQKADNVKDSDLLALSCNNVTEIPKVECEALVLLYTDTAGANWIDHANWLATTTPCSWFGVVCSNNHVTELNLGENNLDGYLPAELGNLTNLINLSLNDNQLYFNIPTTIGNLSSLKILDLYNNQLSGVIGDEIANLTNLEEFALGYNQYGGEIPTALGNLPKLTSLYLNDNYFRGELPGSLVNLTKLNLFWFQNTKLCEPSDGAFQAWLNKIPQLSRTGVKCAISTPTPKPDLSIMDVQPVQAVEGATLVAGKNTSVRVRLAVGGFGAKNVRVKIIYGDASFDIFYPRLEENLTPLGGFKQSTTAIDIPAPIGLFDVFFFLPESFWPKTTDPYQITAVVESDGDPNPANNQKTVEKPVVRVTWGGDDDLRLFVGGIEGNNTLAIGDSIAFVQRTFPVGDLNVKVSYLSTSISLSPIDEAFSFCYLWFSSRQECRLAIYVKQLWKAAKIVDPSIDGVVGITPPNRLGEMLGRPGTRAVTPRDPPFFEWPIGGVVLDSNAAPHALAHELGHIYGLYLPPCEQYDSNCDRVPDNAGIPVVGGLDSFSKGLKYNDFRVGNVTLHVYDFMGDNRYEPPEFDRWVTLDTFQRLIGAATDLTSRSITHLTSSSQAEQPVLLIGGMIKSTGQFSLDPYYVLPAGKPSNLPSQGDVQIQLQGDNNEVLYQGALPSSITFLDTDLPPLDAVPVAVSIPFTPSARSIVIYLFGQEIDRRIISPNAPSIAILSPQPNQAVDQQINVTWQTSDPDGDPVKASVLLSTDGGQTWQTVAMDFEGTSYSIDASLLQPGDSYWIKLIATDGVRTNITTTGPFKVLARLYLPLVQNNNSSTQNSEIAFASGERGSAGVYLMNPDGSNVKKIAAFDKYYLPGLECPTWSPRGDEVAFFATTRADVGDIFIVRVDGSNVRNSTNAADWYGNPVWSPVDDRFAYSTAFFPLRLVAVDSPTSWRVKDSGDDHNPDWSPDGRRLIINSYGSGGSNIFVVNADGSGLTQLTKDKGEDWDPAWSPDGASIAFSSIRDGNREIYLMNADGSNVRRLTNHAANDDNPTWSPDSQQLAFVSDRDGNAEIYVMNADGSNPHNITNSPEQDLCPAWHVIAPLAGLDATSTPAPFTPTSTPTSAPTATGTPILSTVTPIAPTATPIPPTPTSTPTSIPTPGPPPAAPSNLRATALDANRIQLNWQDNANNETGFVLNDGGALAVQIGANVTTYLVTGLTPNSYHCYYVYAFNDYGHSASTGWACATTTNVSNPPTATPTPSPTPTFTPTPTATRTPQPPTFTPTFTPTATPGQAPAAPSNLQARALDANHIQLTWSDNANNETGFAVYDGDIQVATVNANITTYTVSGLAPGSYHCYHLYAFNSFGNSAWTDWACTSTLAPTSTPTNTPTTVLCPRKSEGDADCNGRIDLVDYEIWRQEYYGTLTTKTADFNGDGVVDMTDFAIWQAHYPS